MWVMVQSQRMLSLCCPPQAFSRNTGWGRQNWVFACCYGVCQRVSSIAYSEEHRDWAFNFSFFFFLLEDNYFAILCWPLPFIVVISLRYTYVPSLLNPPPIFHPSGLSQSTGLSSLCHTANSHLLSTLLMVIYIFPCYSLNSSHPLLPLLRLQVYSLCLCLSLFLPCKKFHQYHYL